MNNHLTHIRPEILKMGAYHVPDASGLIKLDAMENPYTLPDDLKALLATHLAQVALNRYPVPSYTALKDALREYAHIPADKDIMLGNGSDELIAMLSQAIAKPNETVTVLAPAPSFVMYKMSGLFNHLNVVEIALNADDFSLDVAAFVAAIEQYKPALVYLPFPN
ncbi:MAG: aminotransferase class I/II-fold pyridoxal phosphate-dependent enzyme, partial [Hydromonas sp.]|nr:aminotransferase class I/II-fold pyridoxal phosphate-dependent enzyme [Hydromonas sp.]